MIEYNGLPQIIQDHQKKYTQIFPICLTQCFYIALDSLDIFHKFINQQSNIIRC